MKKINLKNICQYFIYFVLCSVIGWIYEVFLEVVVYQWGFSNRGVLFGPYCVIYGFGALILIFSLHKLKSKRICIGKISITPILVFISIVIIATIVELIGSYIMEFTTGSWLWDYSKYSFNFQGRIALNPSIRFGIGGMVLIYVFYPLVKMITNKLSNKNLYIITSVLAFIMFIDVIYTYLIK